MRLCIGDGGRGRDSRSRGRRVRDRHRGHPLGDLVEHAVRRLGVRLVQRVLNASASAPPWLLTTTPFRPTSVAPL